MMRVSKSKQKMLIDKLTRLTGLLKSNRSSSLDSMRNPYRERIG